MLQPARSAIVAAMLACAALPAAAQEADDGLTRLLIERQLLAPPPTPAGVVRDAGADLVVAAMNYLGVRYVRGGNGFEQGFDCSGFTRHLFANSLGLLLPRRADEQARAAGLDEVGRQQLEPGDLVFFNTLRRTFSHVGIYIGEGRFIHAPRSGAQVRVEDMRSSYWASRFDGARRAAGGQASAPAAAKAGFALREVQATRTPGAATSSATSAVSPDASLAVAF